MLLDGEDVTGWPAHRLFHRGLARTFQIAQEFSRMTVIENLMVVPPSQSGENLFRAWFAWGKVRERGARRCAARAREVLAQLRLTHLEREYAGNLSGGQKKLLELGRTMMVQPKVVLLDELGAGVNRTLLGELAGEIERLNREHGYTFFVIEHDMDLIARLCDPVIVMAEGRVLTQGTMAEIRRNEAVIEAYLGARHHKRAGEGAAMSLLRIEKLVARLWRRRHPERRRPGGRAGPRSSVDRRPERRRQVDRDEGDLRPGAGRATGSILFDGDDVTRLPADQLVAPRHRLCAAGAQRVSARLSVQREPGDGRVPEAAATSRARIEAVLTLFPPLAREAAGRRPASSPAGSGRWWRWAAR